MLGAEWSSADARWMVDIERTDTVGGDSERSRSLPTGSSALAATTATTRDTPLHFEGRERFTGQIVHPQHWPEDLDYTGKKVVIIGSGATAVTLLPAMAEKAGHVTMLQRSATYIMPVPSKDVFANTAQRVLGPKRGYALARRKNIAKQRYVYQFCQKHPSVARRLIRRLNAKQLPDGYPVDEHFSPAYNPWGPATVRGARQRFVRRDQ